MISETRRMNLLFPFATHLFTFKCLNVTICIIAYFLQVASIWDDYEDFSHADCSSEKENFYLEEGAFLQKNELKSLTSNNNKGLETVKSLLVKTVNLTKVSTEESLSLIERFNKTIIDNSVNCKGKRSKKMENSSDLTISLNKEPCKENRTAKKNLKNLDKNSLKSYEPAPKKSSTINSQFLNSSSSVKPDCTKNKGSNQDIKLSEEWSKKKVTTVPNVKNAPATTAVAQKRSSKTTKKQRVQKKISRYFIDCDMPATDGVFDGEDFVSIIEELNGKENNKFIEYFIFFSLL